ncbi:hypothetical protein F4802DRAFT_428017 [Xylaria palmicola]|nr:hypothetical protein F4802DRAFT_428017 [Xylaria palmicola]
MSSSGQPFGSNNPFRRKIATAADPAASPSPSLSPSPSPSFGTHGPLTSPAPSTATRPPPTTFKSAVPEAERQDEEEQPVQQKPKKIVKRVRVQSPPPSSPEDAVPVTRFPALEGRYDDDDDDDHSSSASDSGKSDDQEDDPFDTAPIEPDTELASEPPIPQIPPNPFARTLQDIEGRGQAHDAGATATAATSASKGSLDVDSFKRLLLTGYANLPEPAQTPPATTRTSGALPDGASGTDASSVSKQSLFDALHETPRTSHEISEPEATEDRKGVFPSSPLATVPSAPTRQKPPPPSSRHGKLIRIELGTDSNAHGAVRPASSGASGLPSPFGSTSRKASSEIAAPLHSPQGATNVNKPLPEPPLQAPAEEDVESPFDREAAGKVPEAFAELQAHPRAATPPPTSRSRSESQTSTQSRKPAAPPPRRHGRSDSKISSIYPTNITEDPPRSSMESSHSRPENLPIGVNSEKPSHAPAPPPPRRPGHARQGSSFAGSVHPGFSSVISPSPSEKDRSPLASNFTPVTSPGVQSEPSHNRSGNAGDVNGQTKLSPPPPPPTRKPSTRRPPSVRSIESGNGPASLRRVSREKDGTAPPPPRPPPPRARGGGRSNPDSSIGDREGVRKGSVGSISTGNGSATPIPTESGKHGEEILADLDALQREVDELMKKANN